MNNKEVFVSFKKMLSEEAVSYNSAYLFGSRARNQSTLDSDWDFLVVLKNKLDQANLRNLKNALRMKFHDKFNYPVDIVLKDEEAFFQEKDIPNTISFNVVKEGVVI